MSLDLAQAKDEAIGRAAGDGCIVVTKDEDFPNLTLVRPEPVAVVWLRVGNCLDGRAGSRRWNGCGPIS